MTRLILTCAMLATILPAAAQSRLEGLLAPFTNFDQNGDGAPEIASVRLLARAGESGSIAVAIVESRLLEPIEGAPELDALLDRWARDQAAEGRRGVVLAVALAPSRLHQDGRYVLALRELLRAIAREEPLEGVLLVGHFPDALLVRVCNWRKQEDITLGSADNARKHAATPFLRRVPELVAHRADIVLADLDGAWERVYQQRRAALESIVATYPHGVPSDGGVASDVEIQSRDFEDFFYIADGRCEVLRLPAQGEEPSAAALILRDDVADHECAAPDRTRPNVIARPDLLVSRLDARGVALSVRDDVRGEDGSGLLDASGRPREVVFASEEKVPDPATLLVRDPVFERRLLAAALDRNHAYRHGEIDVAWRPASLACELGSGYDAMRAAAGDWQDEERGVCDLHGKPALIDAAAWLARPALLRTIRAHSDPLHAAFAPTETARADAAVGGAPYRWVRRGRKLVPSLAKGDKTGRFDWVFLRSLATARRVADSPSFYVHTGCESVSPPGASRLAFDDDAYGREQQAEALLFFGEGLALVGRAKVFYDEPRGFADALGNGATFGAAWAAYFEHESRAATWNEAGGDIGRKRSYFWSVLGDWSLRLTSARPRPIPSTPQQDAGGRVAAVVPDAKTRLWTVDVAAPSFGSGATADLDGDGALEILFGCYFGDETFRCLDAKTGAPRWTRRSLGGPLDASVLAGDLDGRRGLEAVFADSARGRLWCLGADGRERWTFDGPSGTDSPPAAADLDGDGAVEIVYGTMKVKGGAGRVVCLDGKSGVARWIVDVPGHVQSEPALVDLDGDDKLDVLVTNWMGDGRLRALRGRDGSELWSFVTNDWIYHGVSAADFDADGKPEIVVADRAGKVWLLEGESGAVAWTAQLEGEAKGMVFAPTTLVDADGTGALEIAVCGRHLHVLDANGALRWRKSYGPTSIARGVSTADVDGDGAQDLVFGDDAVLRAVRARDGADLWAYDLADPARPGGDIDHAPLLADFDGDGLLDVFVVIGRGRSGAEQPNNHGRAWALRAGAGRASATNSWTTFRGSNRRLGDRPR